MTSAISRRTPTCEELYSEQAREDENNASPILELLDEARGDKARALQMLRDDLDSDEERERWKNSHSAKTAADLDCDLDRAYDIWKAAYLRFSRKRLHEGNPGGWQRYFSEQARWDESHIQPVAEKMIAGATQAAAYAELRAELADPDLKADWISQNADAIAEQGAPSADAAYQVWMDAYLRHSKDRSYRKNPADTDESDAALEKYLEFHRYDAKHLDTVDVKIPEVVYKGGKALHVTYRSRKVDPSTLVRPRRPVDYIHEFNAGVCLYRTEPGEGRERVTVPSEFRQVGALVKLGECLGFLYKGPKGETEGQTSRPMPELACSPDGKCLYVIEGRRRVLAMIWGGALGVFARGIDG